MKRPSFIGNVRRGTRGSAMVEFTLVGIPMIFILFSTFEVARAMWVYHTVAYAAKEATRWVIVHGNDTGSTTTVAQVASQMDAQHAGLGLDATKLQVRLVSASTTVAYQTLQSAAADNTKWPAASTSDVAGNPGEDVQIDLLYTFNTPMSFFWPGAGPGSLFGPYTFPATSKEQIQY